MIRFVFAWPPEPKATGSNPVGRAIPSCGPLAQLAEQQTLNLKVPGSIPGRLTTSFKPLTRISRTRPPRPGVGRLTPRSLPCSVRSRHALSRVYDARVPYFSGSSHECMHGSGQWQVRHAVIEVADGIRCCPEAIGFMNEVPLRDRCSFGRFPWLISQALSVTYMAGERRLYLERNCRLPESPAHSRRRNREGPASSKGLNSQRGFGPAVEPRRKSRPRSTSLHGSSPCKC